MAIDMGYPFSLVQQDAGFSCRIFDADVNERTDDHHLRDVSPDRERPDSAGQERLRPTRQLPHGAVARESASWRAFKPGRANWERVSVATFTTLDSPFAWNPAKQQRVVAEKQ
ncbi:hypothetical protein [Desulfovibrio sp. X2]|uniref:hypothetical protein n=1 Tax=Desulfovibrio sp. X2 TaxID=941449 RepID=UPI00155A5479|nr:hypothetical protein [Desulfovibrio sp. X2]